MTMTGQAALRAEGHASPRQGAMPAPEGRSFSAELAYDTLLEGLESGQYCGIPVNGPAARALVEVLRRRRWPVNPRQFAGATPHFPETFGVLELRASLRNLGLVTEPARFRGRDLKSVPRDTMVLDGGRILFTAVRHDGKPGLLDPVTGEAGPLSPRRIYECFLIEEGRQADPGGTRESTIRQIQARFRRELMLMLLLTLMSSSLVVVASMSVAFIFDAVLPARALDTLVAILCGIAGLMTVDLALRRIRANLVARLSGRLEYILSAELFQKLLDMPLSMLTSASVSGQVSRLRQFETVRDFFGGPVVMVLLDLPFIVVLMVALAAVNIYVGVVMVATLCVFGLIALFAIPRIRTASAQLGARRAEYQRLLTETLSHAGQIAHRGLGPAFAARLQPAFKRETVMRMSLDGLFAFLTTSTAIVTTLSVAGIVVAGAWQVTEGALTGGALIACTILGTRLLAPVQQALFVALRAEEVFSVFRQIDAMMQLPSTSAQPAIIPPDQEHNQSRLPLVIENAVMRYPGTSEPALKGVNLSLEHGTLTCIGGPSGAGKTTLLRAIMGNHPLQSGSVSLGPVNLSQFNGHQKTELIGYLGHRSLLIHGTVAQNLRLCARDASRSDLEAICEELGLLDQIRALPDGFDTVLDQDGLWMATPAFRMRLGVARLLLGEPTLLLLDETEAGLSPEDETRLMEAIDRRRSRMSIILVTHRPSILRRADRVVMLQSGQVRFFGPPDQLDFRRT